MNKNKSTTDRTESAKLMKPLFYQNMYNREGKRIRARFLKSITTTDGVVYPLWIEAGKPENNYPRAENDAHYVYIQTGDFLVPCGYTEYNLEQRAGYEIMVFFMYGNSDSRTHYFAKLRDGHSYEETNKIVSDRIAEENAFISENGKDNTAQANFLKNTFVDPSISQYIEARDNGGKYADFRGAAFLGELDKCVEISAVLRKAREEADNQYKMALAEQERKKAEERAIEEQSKIEAAKAVFLTGGQIDGGEIIVKLADRLGIDIPLRTRGWILNMLITATMNSENSSISIRYRRRAGSHAKGSDTVYSILFAIQNSVKSGKEAKAS